VTFDRGTVFQILECRPKDYPKLLEERHPHVLEEILKIWDSPEGLAFFTDLLRTNGSSGGRLGRNGFSKEVWNEIFRLDILYYRKFHSEAKK
jgi:hypothetical protein